jgi:hypothetical protein
MRRGILIVFGYFLLGIIISCCEEVTHPYYDFKTMEIETQVWENDTTNGNFSTMFSIKLEDFTLYSDVGTNFFNSAYATQPCPENGNEGLKFPITEIKITCDQIFFDTIQSNTDISYLFFSTEYSDSMVSLVNLDVNQYFMTYSRGIQSFFPALYLSKNNLLGIEHVFTFDLKKANGALVSGTSDPVVW